MLIWRFLACQDGPGLFTQLIHVKGSCKFEQLGHTCIIILIYLTGIFLALRGRGIISERSEICLVVNYLLRYPSFR